MMISARYCMQFMAHQLQTMGRTAHRVRSVAAALLVLHFSVHCSSQPLPVLPFNRFGTKNTYNNTCCGKQSESVDDTDFCCPPVQVVVLSRHGIRYPGKKDILNGQSIISELKQREVSPVVVKSLQSVLDSFPLSTASLLAETGAREQWELGHRTAQRYRSTFHTSSHLKFISSSSPRAVSSEKNFQLGFAEGLGWNVNMAHQQRDDLLRFFDVCPRYVADVKKNKTAFVEYQKFRSKMFPDVVRRIAGRLFVDSLNFSDDEVSAIYKLAAVEHAILGTRNWLNLLDFNDLNILEVASDLKQYYKVGYGHPLNYEISCPLIADIFHHMDDTVFGYSSDRGVFYFGHAETIIPLFDAFGLYHDHEPLSADIFDSPSLAEARKFRTSAFAPFSANLALVLYDCGGTSTGKARTNVVDRLSGGDKFVGNISAASSRYFVQLLINERPAKFTSALCGQSICSYSELREFYSPYIDRCRFHQKCMIHTEV